MSLPLRSLIFPGYTKAIDQSLCYRKDRTWLLHVLCFFFFLIIFLSVSTFHSQRKLQQVVYDRVYVGKFKSLICISGSCVQLLSKLMGFPLINSITSAREYIHCHNSRSLFHLGSFFIQSFIIYSRKLALNLNSGNSKNYINLFEVN